VERVGVRDNFFELGGHSLLAVRLFAELERMTGRKSPLVTIFQSPTAELLARALARSQPASQSELLVPLQPQGARPPLILVHGAGGDVLWGYAKLAAHLPADQPLYGIRSRGQAGLQEPRTLEEMAHCYLKELRRLQPEGPYYLGGYCFGGNVAYEMARQLHARGEEVAMVLLLDSAPSNAGYERITWWRPAFIYAFVQNLGYWLSDFAHSTSNEKRRYLKRKLRWLARKLKQRVARGNRNVDVDVEQIVDPIYFSPAELELWRIHLQALTEHVEGIYPGNVILLRTRGQPLFCSFAEDFCWRRLAKAGVDIRRIPGAHENIFMEPNVKYLAAQVQACLAEASARDNRATST
jgi:thioesterase domain-containing protein